MTTIFELMKQYNKDNPQVDPKGFKYDYREVVGFCEKTDQWIVEYTEITRSGSSMRTYYEPR